MSRNSNEGIDLKTEWRRSNPDIVVYIPKGEGLDDEDNEHFLVYKAPKSDELITIWTQSSCEGRGDNHLVIARSSDGEHWSQPTVLVGNRQGANDMQASWGFLVISKQGRIYCFFTKEQKVSEKENRQGAGGMGCFVSDDNGHTWSAGADIPVPKNRYDHPDANMPKGWIVFQKPIRDSKERHITGYTQTSSSATYKRPNDGWVHADSRCAYIRFENLDAGPDPEDLEITWLPSDNDGIAVANPMYPEISTAQEPSTVLLPDGRLFVVMRTMTGSIWYSVSDNDGESWRDPEPLRYFDEGPEINHPMSPGPIYSLADGRFLLLYHNNPGTRGEHSQYKVDWDCNQANYFRNPTYLALGEFRSAAHQPIWFGWPKKILDTGDIPIGPKDTAEIATYTSVTEWNGKRVLWYPDRKYYLLGKYITDELLSDLQPRP